MSVADAYNHLRAMHDKTLALLENAGVDVLFDEKTGFPVSVELADEDSDNAIGQAVDMEDLASRQMETIDALRGVVGVLSRTIESLAPRVGTAPAQSEVPPGCVVVKEEGLTDLYARVHQLQDELEKKPRELERLLEPVSVMLGHGGAVTADFLRYLEGRPRSLTPATAFLLPDGTYTNVIAEALMQWRSANPEIEEAARQKAAAAKFGG